MIRLQEVYQASNGVLLVRDTDGKMVSFFWSEAIMRGIRAAGLSDEHMRQAETAALAEFVARRQAK